MHHWARLATVLPFALLGVPDLAPTILRRHDRDDARYLAAGERWGASVCVVGAAAGTVIGDRWVLTAAHVAENISPFSRSVRCGDRRFAIAAVYTYPGWATKRGAGQAELDLEIPDLALVRLATPATGIPIVRLHRSRREPGRRIIVVGNGLSGTGESGPETDDGRLRAATNVIDSVFGQYFTFTFSPPDDPTATDLEGIGGPGDSGGPAFILRRGRPYVAGVSSINSRGEAAGPSRYRTTEVYARIAPNAAWIDGVMAGRGTPDPVADTVRELAATGWPATAGGVTARRWLEMFNGQDSLEISGFERAFRADSLLARRSADARVATWRNLFADWGPLEAWGYVEAPGRPLVLLVRSEKLGQWMSLTFRLEPAASHRLVGLAIRRPEDAPAVAAPRP